MMGYQPIVRTVYINNEDVVENVIMEESESSTLGEVIVKAKIRDRAEELIRNVIRIREVFWMRLVPIHSMHISKHFN
jgi:hypothetical protein